MYNDKQRPEATPAFSYVKKNEKNRRERERASEGKRDLSLHSERNIYIYSFFFSSSFFLYQSSIFFLFSSSNRHTAQLFSLCSHARTLIQVTSSSSSSSSLTCFLFFIHLTISYTLSSNKKNKRKRQGSLWVLSLLLLLLFSLQ